MIPPKNFFEQGWYKNAAKRSHMRKPNPVRLRPMDFDNIAQIYKNASDDQRKAIIAKLEEAPEPLRTEVLGAL